MKINGGILLTIRPNRAEDCKLACIYQPYIRVTACEYREDEKNCYIHWQEKIDTARKDPSSVCFTPQKIECNEVEGKWYKRYQYS